METVNKTYPLIKRTLSLRLDGTGKAKKVRVISFDMDTDEDNITVHYEANPSSNHIVEATRQFQRNCVKLDRREAAVMVTNGEAPDQDTAVAMVRKGGVNATGDDPLERASKRRRTGQKPRKGTGTGGQSPDIEVLVRCLTAYGYRIILSPAAEKNISTGCRRCIYDGMNRANILPSSTGVRVDFLPRAGFIKKKGSRALIIEYAEGKNQGWSSTDDKVIHYSGKITNEVLMAFGIDPSGKTPDQLVNEKEHKISMDWERRARASKPVKHGQQPANIHNLRRSMLEE